MTTDTITPPENERSVIPIFVRSLSVLYHNGGPLNTYVDGGKSEDSPWLLWMLTL